MAKRKRHRGKAGIVFRHGMPVLTGYDVPKGFDWNGLVRRERERRIRKP